MELLDQVIQWLTNALPFIAAAGGVTVLLQLVKKWLSVQSDKVVNVLLVVFSAIPVAVNYLLQTVTVNPGTLGARTAAIVGLSTVLYQQLVKPTTNLLRDAKIERERRERLLAESTPLTTPIVTDEQVSELVEDPTVAPTTSDEFVA